MKGQLDVETPEEYLAQADEARRPDLIALDALIRETCPDFEPHIRAGLLGYGTYTYLCNGKPKEWCKIGLASNKQYISLYFCVSDEKGYLAEQYREALPKANIGKSCVRFKRLEQLDLNVLKEMLRKASTMDFSI